MNEEILTEKESEQTLPQKAAEAILNWPINKLGTLTPQIIAEKFSVELIALESDFEKEFKKSLEKFILTRKMFVALSLMQNENNILSAKKISEYLGYKNYTQFVSEFKTMYIYHPARLQKALVKTLKEKREREYIENNLIDIYNKYTPGKIPKGGKFYTVKKFFSNDVIDSLLKNNFISITDSEIILTKKGIAKAKELFKTFK